MFCHGQGDQATDGCCWVAGAICPNRLKIVNGRVFKGPNLVDMGTVTQYVQSLTNNGAARNRANQMAQGLIYACEAAINTIVFNAGGLTDRAVFDAAWAARPEYQPIADAWEQIGKPRNWCQLFGPPEGQCCFGEDPATNASKAASLSSSAVTLRRSAQGAS